MKEAFQYIKVLDIYLDAENPRHDPITDQKEIIQYLMSSEQVHNLAKDIANIGATSPIELVGVYKNEDGHFIALEGNRRICALKLLNDPKQAPKGKVTSFQKLQSEAEHIPDEVMTVVFESRQDADIWLDRRHLGQQEGVGVKAWDSSQKTRKNRQRNNSTKDQNILAQALLDYANKYNIIGEYPRRVLTTATRYLSNPHFRKAVGIISERSDPEIIINVTHEDFEIFLGRFCEDLIEGKKVSSRSNVPERLKYLEALQEEGIAPYDRVTSRALSARDEYVDAKKGETTVGLQTTEKEEENSTDNTTQKSKKKSDKDSLPSNDATNKTRSTKNPDKRKYILPDGFKIRTQNKIVRRIANEMGQIEVKEYPLAVAMITRAFLEATYYGLVESVTGNYPGAKQTHSVIDQVYNLLKEEVNEKIKNGELKKAHKNALSSLKKLGSNQYSPLSPQTLGGFAHAGAYPDHTALKREFDNIAPIIEYILPRI